MTRSTVLVGVRLVLALAVIVCQAMALSAQTGKIVDDFADGNLKDGQPVSWTLASGSSLLTSSGGDLHLRASGNGLSVVGHTTLGSPIGSPGRTSGLSELDAVAH